MNFIGLVLLGIVAGILSGLLGIGGGIILVPGLVYLVGMDMHNAVGTSLVIIIPTALIGGLLHHFYGNVDIKSFILISAGTVLGVVLGTILSNCLPEVTLKRIFGIVFLLVSLKMIFFSVRT